MIICQRYRLQRNFLSFRSFFLVHLIKKRRKKKPCTMTTLETSHHNLILTWLLQYSQYICYLFLHSRELIHMECFLVYSDAGGRTVYTSRWLETFQRLFMLLFVHSCHLPFKVILWITDLSPHDHCGRIKHEWRTTFSTSSSLFTV